MFLFNRYFHFYLSPVHSLHHYIYISPSHLALPGGVRKFPCRADYGWIVMDNTCSTYQGLNIWENWQFFDKELCGFLPNTWNKICHTVNSELQLLLHIEITWGLCRFREAWALRDSDLIGLGCNLASKFI